MMNYTWQFSANEVVNRFNINSNNKMISQTCKLALKQSRLAQNNFTIIDNDSPMRLTTAVSFTREFEAKCQ